MSIELNKTITRRYFEELWNKSNAALIPDLVAADVTGHVFEGGEQIVQGAELLKQRVGNLRQVYSNANFRVEDQIAEGDRVVVRWTLNATNTGDLMGRKATGKNIAVTGTNTFRIANGKIAEIWVNADDLAELKQLGVSTIQ
ncbi:MAG: ester cyclase [Chloroflexi bacterium]|nr:ester cyclase [Chloroflexota bacterium]